jgi:hypothetical protein
MNNTILVGKCIYWRCHKVYSLSRHWNMAAAEYKWNWRKFKKVEVKPARPKYELYISYSIYNEVTKKLENADKTWTFWNKELFNKTWESFIEQLKNQDPVMRYVDDALHSALKEDK